jgi:hypothetical protein
MRPAFGLGGSLLLLAACLVLQVPLRAKCNDKKERGEDVPLVQALSPDSSLLAVAYLQPGGNATVGPSAYVMVYSNPHREGRRIIPCQIWSACDIEPVELRWNNSDSLDVVVDDTPDQRAET